ncbi:MAG TPA: amidohydrolase family protein [bacterium]|nr:amidohydrolase family protein [bacterium]
MKTLIEGGWVVAHNGTSHEVYQNGAVVIEDDHIVHAGGAYAGPADARIDARGKLVSPGFINTHIHSAGPGGDYMLQDFSRSDWRTANYMAFAAPTKGKAAPPPPKAVAALRAFVFLHALKGGSTTILDVGGHRGDWDGYVDLVDRVGLRVYTSPTFHGAAMWTDEQGRVYWDPNDDEMGRKGLAEAVEFIRKYDGAAHGRLRGMLSPAHVEDSSPALLRAAVDAQRDLDVPMHTHAGGNLLEFNKVMGEHRKTPVQFLADLGFLNPRTIIGHAVFTTAHPWTHYPFGDDVKALADSGATVGHCPYKYAKMAMTLHSFQSYLDAGVRMALGTDTYPMDMVSELRMAAMLARVTDGNYRAGTPRDVYNAATLGPCDLLGRKDLGRLAPGAKADVLLIDLDHMGAACYRDPVKALVDFGCGRDVDTVIVDGQVLVSGGRHQQLNEGEVFARAQQAVARYWQGIRNWHWDGADIDRIVPPSFPTHRADG